MGKERLQVEEKGVSSIIVIAIVIVIAAVSVGGYFLLKGKGTGPGGLSIYSGSQDWDISSEYRADIPAGLEVAGYSIGGVSVQETLNWYKGQMTGWTLVNEVPATSYGEMTAGSLLYRKGDVGASIAAMSGMGLPGTCYIIATGPWPAFGGIENRPVPPTVMLTVSARDDPGGVLLTISHEGGDDLVKGDLTVKAIKGTTSAENTNIGTGTLSVGNSLQVLVNLSVDPNEVITVYIIHVPTQQKLFASASILVQAGQGTPPSAMLTVRAEKSAANTIELTITHEGGDDLAISDLQIKATNHTNMATIDDLTDLGVGTTFSVGESGSISYTYNGVETGNAITVYIIHVPSRQKIFSSSSVVVQGGRGTPPSAMLTVTATIDVDQNITLTISHEGGDDLVFADLEIKADDSDATMVTGKDNDLLGKIGTTFNVGETVTMAYPSTDIAAGNTITVFIIHTPSKQKLFSSSSIIVR